MKRIELYEEALDYFDVTKTGEMFRKEMIVSNKRQTRKFKRKRIKYRTDRYNYFHFKGSVLCVHVLVALKYIPKPEGWNHTWDVNHINCVKTDNRVENLEWVTHSENIQHARKNRLFCNKKGINSKPVEQINLSTGEVIAIYKSQTEAAETFEGFSTAISACCRGKNSSAYGYGWRYAM